MTGERKGKREGMERFAAKLVEQGVKPPDAERIAREAAVRSDRKEDGDKNPRRYQERP